ncbi:MAG: hypothetical protein ACR2LQ_03475, partial [Acidimicrobiales bacterium]
MTRPDLGGYWPSPWPCEDGGPTRQQTLPAAGLAFTGASPTVTSRTVFGANMTVLRDPGEVFLQGNTLGGPDTTAWVERIDPTTLEPNLRSPDLAGGPFWAGGIAAHRNGSLYVTYGRWCHRLDADTLAPIASTELPRSRPYKADSIGRRNTSIMEVLMGTMKERQREVQLYRGQIPSPGRPTV